MKKIIVILIFFFAAAALAATESSTDEGHDQPREEKVQAAGEVSPPDPEKDEEWPRPFVSSEQIGADMVVTFPADI